MLETFINLFTKHLVNTTKYKIIITEDNLNEIIKHEIHKNDTDLKKIHVTVDENSIHIGGIIANSKTLKKNKIHDLHFELLLKKEGIKYEKAFLHVTKTRVFNPKKTIDYYDLLSKFTNKVQQELLKTITEESNNYIKLEKKWELISVNLRSVVKDMPKGLDFLSKIKILNYTFEENQLIFYIESNLLFKNILRFFSSLTQITVDQINHDYDTLKLLLRK